MSRQRDSKGRFTKGNTEGQKINSGKAAEMGRKGGVASGESRRYAKTFAEALRRIMDEPASAASDIPRREIISMKVVENLYKNPTIKDLKIAAELMGELEQSINLNHNISEKPVINIVSKRSGK